MSNTLEPFPLFIDSTPPEYANYFSNISSKMESLNILSSDSSAPRMFKRRISMPSKLSKELQMRYYQYEVTFGLYMLTGIEKMVLNMIVASLFAAGFFALYQVVCRLAWIAIGSFEPAGMLCNTHG